MLRHMKVFGSIVAVALALGAISASAASGAEFHSEVEPTIYKASGDGSQVLVTPAGTTTCTGVTFEATTTVKTNATLTASSVKYTGSGTSGGCIEKTIFGNIDMTVNFSTDECGFVFHANGDLDIECKKPGGITVAGPGCSTVYPTQTGLQSVIYDNKGTGTTRDLTLTMIIKGIRGVATGSFCSKQGEFTTGEYSGNITLQGFEDNAIGAQVGIWWE
jgi:hypothetical protein